MMPSSSLTLYGLSAHAPDESIRIEILDGNLRPVALPQNLGDVSVQVPAGVYAVRFYRGPQFTEKLATLLPGSAGVHVDLGSADEPMFATAAPVRQTTTTRETQREPARRLSLSPPITPLGHTGGSHLLLFLRDPFEGGEPTAGVTLHDVDGEQLADLDQEGQRSAQERWAAMHLNLDPGPYRLRRRSVRTGFVEQMVFTVRDWQTQAFLMMGDAPGQQRAVVRTSILMGRPNLGFNPERDDLRWTESALRALESKGNIPGSVRTEMLWAKFENPMLGIYAGLLHLRRTQIDPGLLTEVFDNLRRLVGLLPDVLAIGWGLVTRAEHARTPERMAILSTSGACAVPPMLAESWQHLLRATIEARQIVPPGSLADRVGGRLVSGTPWVRWKDQLPPPEPLPETPPPMPDVEGMIGGADKPPEPDVVEGVPSIETSEPGTVRSSSLSELLLSALATIGSQFTLGAGLPLLAEWLSKYADAAMWLRTPRFTDLERRLAYWLAPVLDPRLADVSRADSKLAGALRSSAKQRAADLASLLAELDMTSTTALRTAWAVFTKLFLRPVVPLRPQLEAFAREESRGQEPFVKLFAMLGKVPSELQEPMSGRTLTLVEVAFLYYRGSPADEPAARPSTEGAAALLAEAGFVVASRGAAPAAADISVHHSLLQRRALAYLERAERSGAVGFRPMWQLQVFPLADRGERRKLLPMLISEEEATAAEWRAKPDAPPPAATR